MNIFANLLTYGQMMKLLSQTLQLEKNISVAIRRKICGWKEDMECGVQLRLFKNITLCFISYLKNLRS